MREAAQKEAAKVKKAAKGVLSEFGDVKSTGASIAGVDSKGKRLWSVGAREIRLHDEKTDENGKVTPRNAELVDARATLYRDGKAESTFRSKNMHLVYAPQGVLLDLTENVQMVTSGALFNGGQVKGQPIILTAPKVHIDVKARKIRADSGAQMQQAKTVVTARKVAADSGLGVVYLNGGVKAVAPEADLSAKDATWNWQAGKVVANGDIVLNRQGTKVSGKRIDADTNIARGILSGGAQAVSGEGNATAGEVHYDWKAGTLSARGGVKLAKEGATLTAARLDTDDKLNGATASGGVTLLKDDVTMRASRLSAMDKMTRAIASGGITLTRSGDTVRAGEATVWINEKRAVGSGGVSLQHGDLNVSGGRVEAFNFGDKTKLRVVASGDVRARVPQGDVRASHVTWGGGRVVASGGVTVRRDGYSLRGDRMESDDQFREAKLQGNIGGGLAGGGTVSAGSLVWRRDGSGSGRIIGRGGVRARRDTLTLTADNLDSTGDGSDATLTGNVKVVSDDGKTLTAPTVRYDKKAAKVYATGGVVFIDSKLGWRQEGKTLVADLELEQATLTSVKGQGNLDILKDKKFR